MIWAHIIIKLYMAPGVYLLSLNWRFLAIAMLTLLLGSIYLAFTIGFFLSGWGSQYRYELFYFPSPVASTLVSLTSTGRMVSLILPIVAVSSLLLSALVFRLPSPRMISTEQQRQQASLPGAPGLKQLPTGIFAVSTTWSLDLANAARSLMLPFKHDFLSRLFPYEAKEPAPSLGRSDVSLTIKPVKT